MLMAKKKQKTKNKTKQTNKKTLNDLRRSDAFRKCAANPTFV